MKLIVAYVQPHKLNDVKQELYKAEVFKISVTNAMGCGQQKGYHETYRGVDTEVYLLKKVRIEIGVNDNFVKPTVDAIIKGARTGEIGMARFSSFRWRIVYGSEREKEDPWRSVKTYKNVGICLGLPPR
jgi:nitrogen regulatory protein P-II 1